MKVLFLESRAARQIREYYQRNDLGDPEELLDAAYENGRVYYDGAAMLRPKDSSYEDWWVNQCLGYDSHKDVDVNLLMEWDKTPEGALLWSRIQAMKGVE